MYHILQLRAAWQKCSRRKFYKSLGPAIHPAIFCCLFCFRNEKTLTKSSSCIDSVFPNVVESCSKAISDLIGCSDHHLFPFILFLLPRLPRSLNRVHELVHDFGEHELNLLYYCLINDTVNAFILMSLLHSVFLTLITFCFNNSSFFYVLSPDSFTYSVKLKSLLVLASDWAWSKTAMMLITAIQTISITEQH